MPIEHEEQLDDQQEESQEAQQTDKHRLDEYLKLAKNAHQQAESFMEAGLLARWRKNYALAQSEHPEGSKYHTDAYKNRSRAFRGKTESSIRKNEAALAVAMFSNRDVVSVTPENPDDDAQVECAKNIHKITNYRLDNSIKWFMLAIGAYHEAQIVGDVCSEQYWDYEEDEDGNVLVDKPAVELYPPENVKISPHAHWLDPINSSPYLIIEIPMFICDIKERMVDDWLPYSDAEIKRSAVNFKYNSVKSARQGEEQTNAESTAAHSSVTDYDVVFVHKNIIRKDGEDLFYYTLGTALVLSEPVPLSTQYPHLKRGQRPFVWGTATIEPHKVYHRSLTDRVSGTQAQSNEIANMRYDNVRQVLNKRKYVQRHSGVDYAALRRSVPGGTVLMDDINAVKPEDVSDVTSSSYQEQHMVNADFDELAGSFSNGSVATNRAMNDTVGGMQLLKGDSNTLTEYQLRVFTETWTEPVVRQIVEMVKFYEDDKVIQAVTHDDTTSEDLQIEVETRVSVGFGSTDPQQKIEKLVYGLSALGKIVPPELFQRDLDIHEIAREVFAALGFNDGKKFMPNQEEGEQQNPEIEQLMQQLQQLQKIIETDQIKADNQKQIEEMKIGASREKLLSDRQLKLAEMALNRGIKYKELEGRLGTDSNKLNLELLKELNRKTEANTQRQELDFKMRTGKDGI